MEKHFQPEDFKFVGKLNALYLRDQVYGQTLRKSRNLVTLYENMILLEDFVEKNWNYKIQSINSKRIIINSFPNEELEYLHKEKTYTNNLVNQIRLGFAETMPQYLRKTNSKAVMKKSVLQGDSFCQFEVDFTYSRQLPHRLSSVHLQ